MTLLREVRVLDGLYEATMRFFSRTGLRPQRIALRQNLILKASSEIVTERAFTVNHQTPDHFQGVPIVPDESLGEFEVRLSVEDSHADHGLEHYAGKRMTFDFAYSPPRVVARPSEEEGT